MNKPSGRRPLPQRLSHRQQHHPLLLPRQPRLSNSSVSTMQTTFNLQEFCMSRVNKNNLSNIHKCTNIQTHKCTNAEIHKFTKNTYAYYGHCPPSNLPEADYSIIFEILRSSRNLEILFLWQGSLVAPSVLVLPSSILDRQRRIFRNN